MSNVPTSAITKDMLNTSIIDILVAAKIIPSKSEGRRLIQQGGLSINNEKVTDVNAALKEEYFTDGSVLVKRGKKNYNRIIIE
jgi:tyrosyl-tRNA synthetase